MGENHVHLDGAWDIDYLLWCASRWAHFLPEERVPMMLQDRNIRIREVALQFRQKLLDFCSANSIKARNDDAVIDELGSVGNWDRFKTSSVYSQIMEDFRRHVELDRNKSPPSLWEFLCPFTFFTPIIQEAYARGGPSILEEFAFRFVKRQKESNVLYTEVRYSPHLVLSD